MALFISPNVRKKLAQKRPPVADEEIEQCFANRTHTYLADTREDHRTDPPTRWFISETDYGRKLKVVFIRFGKDIHIRTAYDPNRTEQRIYDRHAPRKERN